MSKAAGERTLFFFEKPSAMQQLQRFFTSPKTVCVTAENHLLAAQEPGCIRPERTSWRFETLPILLDTIPVSRQGSLGAVAQARAPRLSDRSCAASSAWSSSPITGARAR